MKSITGSKPPSPPPPPAFHTRGWNSGRHLTYKRIQRKKNFPEERDRRCRRTPAERGTHLRAGHEDEGLIKTASSSHAP
jgi:hypothetical protein